MPRSRSRRRRRVLQRRRYNDAPTTPARLDMTNTIWYRRHRRRRPGHDRHSRLRRSTPWSRSTAVRQRAVRRRTFVACATTSADRRHGIRTTEAHVQQPRREQPISSRSAWRLRSTGWPARGGHHRLRRLERPRQRFATRPHRRSRPGCRAARRATTGATTACERRAVRPLDCTRTMTRTRRTVWFRFERPGHGTAIFSANGRGFDSVLAVYRDGQLRRLQRRRRRSSRAVAAEHAVTAGPLPGAGRRDTASPPTPTTATSARPSTSPPIPPPPDRTATRSPTPRTTARQTPPPTRTATAAWIRIRIRIATATVGDPRCPTSAQSTRDRNRDGCLDPAAGEAARRGSRLPRRADRDGLRVVFLQRHRTEGFKGARALRRRCRFARKASAAGRPIAFAARTCRSRSSPDVIPRRAEIRIYVTRRDGSACTSVPLPRGGFNADQTLPATRAP